MALGGYAAGGISTGFGEQQAQNTNDAKLSLAQRIQDNAEQQQQTSQVQKIISDNLAQIGTITKTMVENGKDPNSIAGLIQPLVDSTAKLAATKFGPEAGAMVQQRAAAFLGQPAGAGDKETYSTHVITDPITGKQSIIRSGKNSGEVKAFDPMGNPMPATPVTPPTAPTGPSVNLTAPGTTITGVSVDGQPTAAPPATFDQRFAGGPEDATLPSAAKPVESTALARPADIPVEDPNTKRLIEGGAISQNALDYRAQLWLLNQKSTVGLGRGKQGAAIVNAIQSRAAEIAQARGLDPGELNAATAATHAAGQALTQLTKTKNSIEQFENTAIKNGDALVQLAQKVDQTGIPVVERWLRAGKQATGNPDVAAFNAQMQLYKAEVAKILTNPNLTGVLTDYSQQEITRALQPGASFQQIATVHNLLKQDFQRRSSAIDEQISKVMDSFQQKPSKAPAAPAQSSDDKQRLKEKYGLK